MHHGPSRRSNTLPPGYPRTPNRATRRVMKDATKYAGLLSREWSRNEKRLRYAKRNALTLASIFGAIPGVTLKGRR